MPGSPAASPLRELTQNEVEPNSKSLKAPMSIASKRNQGRFRPFRHPGLRSGAQKESPVGGDRKEVRELQKKIRILEGEVAKYKHAIDFRKKHPDLEDVTERWTGAAVDAFEELWTEIRDRIGESGGSSTSSTSPVLQSSEYRRYMMLRQFGISERLMSRFDVEKPDLESDGEEFSGEYIGEWE
eukprot:Clim_evm5s33 gene=Clim_evmTU5s33